jgi:HK97 family phage major capsid protein
MSLPALTEDATIDQVREALGQVARDVVGIRARAKDGDLSDADKADLRSHINFINEFDVVEKGLSALERNKPESRGPSAPAPERHIPRTFAERVTADEGYAAFARSGKAGSDSFDIKVEGSMFKRNLLESTPGDNAGGYFIPILQPEPPLVRQRRLFVRDLLTVTQTGLGNAIPYILEVNALALEGGASAVAEAGLKPEADMLWRQEIAPVRKIAAWIPMTTEIIEDAPTLRGYVDQRLLYLIALREEFEVLNGDGTGAHIKGIRNFAEKQLQAVVTGDFPATIGMSIAKIENVDGEADGVVCNPLDFWTSATTRHSSQFDNGFGGNAPAVLSAMTWGLPVVRTRGIESGKALTGAWRLAATLHDREQALIRVGNQHSDFFIYNKVAVLGEERVALANHRPDLFCEATVPAAA